jgi:putative peptide zinc metalloprotease protein
MNPLIEVSDFDSDSGKPMVLCTLPSAGDHVRFALPALYMELVRGFDGERTTDEAIGHFLERHPDAFVREWLHRLVDESLIRKGILVHPDQDPGRVAVSTQPRRAFLYIKLPIIKPSVVDPIARRLGFLFRPVALIVGLLLFVASHLYVYGVLIGDRDIDFNGLNAASILMLMLLSTLGTFCHEFGHAAAAAHYGCRRMTIGWGLYLIYTVLWTNVSDAWKLPRRQRAIVDLGGVHFESMFLLVMLGLHLHTGSAIFLFAFLFIDVSIATTFNPFLRMDGYWLMSDLFGIVNLRKQQSIWMRGLAARMFGGAEPPPSGLSDRAKTVLAIYTVLGLLFLGYILVVIYEVVILTILAGYPGMVGELWGQLQGGMPVLDALGGVLEIAWRTLVIVGAAVTLWSLFKGGINLVARLRSVRLAAVGRGG